MARPPKDPAARLSQKVEARLSASEKAALEKLCDIRGRELASKGIADGGSFSVWLRYMIHREAAAAGFPIEDVPSSAPALPSPSRRRHPK